MYLYAYVNETVHRCLFLSMLSTHVSNKQIEIMIPIFNVSPSYEFD